MEVIEDLNNTRDYTHKQAKQQQVESSFKVHQGQNTETVFNMCVVKVFAELPPQIMNPFANKSRCLQSQYDRVNPLQLNAVLVKVHEYITFLYTVFKRYVQWFSILHVLRVRQEFDAYSSCCKCHVLFVSHSG